MGSVGTSALCPWPALCFFLLWQRQLFSAFWHLGVPREWWRWSRSRGVPSAAPGLGAAFSVPARGRGAQSCWQGQPGLPLLCPGSVSSSVSVFGSPGLPRGNRAALSSSSLTLRRAERESNEQPGEPGGSLPSFVKQNQGESQET